MNKEQELKEEIEKIKSKVYCKFKYKRFRQSRDTLHHMLRSKEAELKGYQEARKEFERFIDELKFKYKIKGDWMTIINIEQLKNQLANPKQGGENEI